MPIYLVGNDRYDIPEEQVEQFLQAFPEAKLEEVKMTPQEAGAPVAEVAAPDMDFSLEDGSLEPPKTEITPLQSIKNAISNVGKDFSRVGEFWTGESGTAELAGAAIFETAFGRKTAENLVDKYGKDSWLTHGS